MPQLTIRLSEGRVKQIRDRVREKRFDSPTALIRYAVEQELSSDEETMEHRIAATLDQIRWDLRSLGKTLNALFAFVDTLAKVVVRSLPDQTTSSARMARERYELFLKQAASAMEDGGPAARSQKAEP